ncbi:hypothetical protein [Chryseobacterium sp. 7]|uniref:hypothetical protein n=1 Tax=Chryseobacterium sp. 7 TaxID=2035214 RepID=UPI0011C4AC62|nr:hypothetical protein [Chryseobacterium sp. 7]
MIRFIRLLFYHIYTFYYRKEGKSYSKYTTFGVFLVLISVLATTIYDLVYQYYDINYTTLSGKAYVIACVVIGIISASYLYKEGFEDFNENYDYNKKYYYYFFIIVLFTLGLFIYKANISRERIFKQREMHKTSVEMKK